MYIMYVDESGDPGLKGPSPLFVLSGLVVHELVWLDYLDALIAFRRLLRLQFGLKLREEIHAGEMFRHTHVLPNISKPDKLTILRLFAKRLASMPDFSVINVVVKKAGKSPAYDVFDNAWRTLIQRFENTIAHRNFKGPANADERGILIADDTNVHQLRSLLRGMRRYNPIPSQIAFAATAPYRIMPLKKIIEDPTFRNSRDSFFVQAADTLAYLLYQREVPNSYARRKGIPAYFKILDPILCKVAATSNPEGIVRI